MRSEDVFQCLAPFVQWLKDSGYEWPEGSLEQGRIVDEYLQNRLKTTLTKGLEPHQPTEKLPVTN